MHSHNIAWGSGSGQQSITAHKSSNDKGTCCPPIGYSIHCRNMWVGLGSLWLIKEAYGDNVCNIGAAIKCGDVVRLEHVDTGKNLHSHLFRSPLSGQQEVSGFGEGGNGDTGDNWQVLCDSSSEKYWNRYDIVSFMHVDTKKYLSTSNTHRFNQANCGGNCPIMDQTEVAAASRRDASAKWFSDQGVYFPSKETRTAHEDDDEL